MNHQIIPAHRKFDHTDLFWLGYLLFFLLEPIERHSAVYWTESIAVMTLFTLIYLAFLWFIDLRLRLALLGIMFLMGVLCYPWNMGSPAFMIYAAALLPFIVSSLPWIFAGLAFDALTLCLIGWHTHTTPYSWGINAFMIFAAGAGNTMFAQKYRADGKLRMKQEEIEALAAVAERERIARDLHDVLGHTLSVIVLKSELAGRLLERECDAITDATPATLTRARNEIGDVERTARTALAEVREAIGGYRARGLGAEIEAARSTLASAGVTLITEDDAKPEGLTAAEETVLALALREAVTNIVRHAQATTCTLRLRSEDGRQRLSVVDNGQHATAREGNGLRGMRERVESLGGQLSLNRESGTQLLIELPLRAGA